MYITSGTELVGTVDQVPGLFHVATRCFHIGHAPLIPTGTWLVIDGSEEEVPGPWWDSAERWSFRGTRIAFSARSYLMAWLRFLSVCAAAVLLVLGAVVVASNLISAFTPLASMLMGAIALAGGGFALGVAWLSLKSTRAGVRRAIELGAMLGLPEKLVRDHLRGMGIDASRRAPATAPRPSLKPALSVAPPLVAPPAAMPSPSRQPADEPQPGEPMLLR